MNCFLELQKTCCPVTCSTTRRDHTFILSLLQRAPPTTSPAQLLPCCIAMNPGFPQGSSCLLRPPTLHLALWNVLSGPHHQPSSCDWLPRFHFPPCSVECSNPPRSTDSCCHLPGKIPRNQSPQSALTEFLAIMQT